MPDVQGAMVESPRRGTIVPSLDGHDETGARVRTRDFYMRRNLALVFVGDDDESQRWIVEAASIVEAAMAEVGHVLLVAPAGVDTRGLEVMLDSEGAHRRRYGIGCSHVPALFIVDRYGTLFAASHGLDGIADLRPTDIPRWLEFIACRCS